MSRIAFKHDDSKLLWKYKSMQKKMIDKLKKPAICAQLAYKFSVFSEKTDACGLANRTERIPNGELKRIAPTITLKEVHFNK